MPIRLAILLLSLFCLTRNTQGIANDVPLRIPVILKVGVIPVQVDGQPNHNQFSTIEGNINKYFSQTVRRSNRFRVANDEVSKSLWSTTKGRAELRNEHDLDAILSLTLFFDHDRVSLVTRLQDLDLKTLLIETSTLNADSFSKLGESETKRSVEELTFRLLNRLPVDATIGSIEGSFVTLTAGRLQNLALGNEIEIIRTELLGTHPANGSWLSFKQRPLGKAIIIDVKERTSVAKLLSQNFPGAVEIGDGTRIAESPSRSYFVRPVEIAQLKDKGDPIVVEPLYPARGGGDELKKAQARSAPRTFEELEVEVDKDSSAGGKRKSTFAATPIVDNDTKTEIWRGYLAKFADDLVVTAGMTRWTFSGPIEAQSKLPPWIINSVGAQLKRQVWDRIHFSFGGGVGFGSTTKGSFSIAKGQANLFWEEEISTLGPLVTHWQGGARGHFVGLGVSKEKFGGGDWAAGGGFAGLRGKIFGEGTDFPALDWYGDFSLIPLTLGRVGYGASQHTIKSSLGYAFQIGAIESKKKQTLEWGGALNFESKGMLLDDGKEAGFNSFDIRALARWRY